MKLMELESLRGWAPESPVVASRPGVRITGMVHPLMLQMGDDLSRLAQ